MVDDYDSIHLKMLEKDPATKVKNTNASGVAFFRLRRAFFNMTIPPFVLLVQLIKAGPESLYLLRQTSYQARLRLSGVMFV